MTLASSAWTTTRTTPWSSPATKPPTKPLIPAKKQIDKLIASVRAVCEHAFAHLKNWRILIKLRLPVRHATTLLRVLLVLTNIEIAR
ncbi:transposase family protein [Streptomyces sp. NPDC056982]|uniref:transposase family protein n=1 Tax=Streptomyces sp. NPDC056982 TaxID=3345986 RepID=UPI003630AB92